MSLGEAFVEVRADLRPFGRDLQRGVKPMVEAFERQLNNAVGKAMLANSESDGRKVGERLSRGIKNSLTHQFQNKSAFVAIASTLAGALDDGVSALPTEVKAALVAGIIAASPLVAGALAAAISAGLGVGLVAVGVLLASQFDLVQTRAVTFGRTVRTELVNSAKDFVPAILTAFDIIEVRIRQNRDAFDEIFNVSSNFVEPLVQGALDALSNIIDRILSNIDDIKPFVDELGAAFDTLGEGIGRTLEIMVATGEDGQKAFRDLVTIISVLLVGISTLIFLLTKLYGVMRTVLNFVSDIGGGLFPVIDLIDAFFDKIDRSSNESKSFVNTNTTMISSVEGLIVATKGETDALGEYIKAIEDATDAAKSNVSLNVAWEQSLDDIAESLERNGKTLDVHTQKGRDNINEFLNGLQIAEDRALLRVQRGELSAEQAANQYKLETEQLRALATQAGISGATFDALFSEIVATSQLRISSTEMGVDELGNAIDNSESAAARLLATLQLIKHLSMTFAAGAVGGVRNFAEGGMHYFPELVRVAEDGPEVTIPLTKPARAAQLVRESGLSSILSGSGESIVYVYVGNEQLESHVVRVVQRNNNAQSLAVAHGGRTL